MIGHCVGIEDRFNVCLDHYDESVAFLDICWQRCYKVHLDEQCHAVKMGMELTRGVFLGKQRLIEWRLVLRPLID